MMKTAIVLSERQKPRALKLMKAIYASHITDHSCGLGEACRMMVNLKQRIETLEKELGDNFFRSSGLK